MFRRRQFFSGEPAHQGGRDDLDWYRPDGALMTSEDWGASYARAVTMALGGDADSDVPFLLLFNAWWEPLDFAVPDPLRNLGWLIEVDTADPATTGTLRRPSRRRSADRTLADAAARHTAFNLIPRAAV